MEREAGKYLGIFAAIGVANFALQVVQGTCFGIAGEALLRRLRGSTYRTLIQQQPAFFDDPDHGVSRMGARIGINAKRMQLALGPGLADKISSIATGVAGLIIAFTASWRIALLIVAIVPFVAFASDLESKVTLNLNAASASQLTQASTIASDALASVRTVTAYSLQQRLVTVFAASLLKPFAVGRRRGLVLGAGVGVSQFLQPAYTALLFWAGARWVSDGVIGAPDLFQARAASICERAASVCERAASVCERAASVCERTHVSSRSRSSRPQAYFAYQFSSIGLFGVSRWVRAVGVVFDLDSRVAPRHASPAHLTQSSSLASDALALVRTVAAYSLQLPWSPCLPHRC